METLFECQVLSTWKGFRNCQCWEADGCTPARAPCKVCPTGGCIPSSLEASHNKITIHDSETSPRRNTRDGKGMAEQVSLRRNISAHLHLCLLCFLSRSAPGLGNTAAHAWKGLSALSKEEPINGLFPSGKKCYLFSVALKGVKNQDCDHNRDHTVAYAHQCLKLTF